VLASKAAVKLTPALILAAYRRGLFPMADPKYGRLAWYEADPRGIIPLDAAHVPRRLRRYMRQFEFAVDRDFAGVIDGCTRPVTWISSEIREAYIALHLQGQAHSVEAWKGGKLAGGLYGVHIGGAFMAESMFHRESNASGAALATLIDRLKVKGFALLDIQQVLPTTARYGAIEISRDDYLRRLDAALKLSPAW
jgi:leucyl/phenylalanyl-tRNA--protein transferase